MWDFTLSTRLPSVFPYVRNQPLGADGFRKWKRSLRTMKTVEKTTTTSVGSTHVGGGLITPAVRIHADKSVKQTSSMGGGVITPAVRIHATRG